MQSRRKDGGRGGHGYIGYIVYIVYMHEIFRVGIEKSPILRPRVQSVTFKYTNEN